MTTYDLISQLPKEQIQGLVDAGEMRANTYTRVEIYEDYISHLDKGQNKSSAALLTSRTFSCSTRWVHEIAYKMQRPIE